MMHRLTVTTIMVTLLGLFGLTGCMGGLYMPTWLYGPKPMTKAELIKSLPPMPADPDPAYCNPLRGDRWRYPNTVKGYRDPKVKRFVKTCVVVWDEQDRIEKIQSELVDGWIAEVKAYRANAKAIAGGHGGGYIGPDREVTIITGPNSHVRGTVIKNPDAGDRFRAIGSGGKWGAYAW